MSEQIKYVLGVALILLLVASGWYIRGLYEDSIDLKLERVRDVASEAAATEIAKIKVENKTIYNKTLEKINTEVQYRECAADTTMMDLTNKAIMGAAWK